MLVVTACAGYAYYVNSKRPDDDPKKRNYHPVAVILAPITVPVSYTHLTLPTIYSV